MLDIKHKSTKAALKRLKLDHIAPLAYGTTAAVYEWGDGVIRLTMDAASHEFLIRSHAQTGLASPIIHHDFGEVGDYLGEDIDVPFYAAELEKLSSLSEFPDLLDSVNPWLALLTGNDGAGLYNGETDKQIFKSILTELETMPSMDSRVLKTLWFVAEIFHSDDVDLCQTNFMVRPDDRQVLVTDPVHD